MAAPSALCADTSHARLAVPTGTATSQETSRASPAGISIRRAGSSSAAGAALAVTSTGSAARDALRTVNVAANRSPSRSAGGSPESRIRSWRVATLALPVP